MSSLSIPIPNAGVASTKVEIQWYDSAGVSISVTSGTGSTNSNSAWGLREVSADATAVIVSQRISTVAEADQIVVVDDGRVVGIGSHETLLATCPTYAEIVSSQVAA